MVTNFKSILVVCVGNVCRSPVGERRLSALLPDTLVSSAGLDAVIGAPANPPAAAAAARHGVDVSGHVARQFTPSLASDFDLILVMERSHRREIAELAPHLSGKTMLFGHWIDGGLDIPDPYRRGDEVQESVVLQILRASDAWAQRLNEGRGGN